MKNEIKKLQKMIADLSEYSEMEISRYSKENIDEIKSYTIKYNFHFDIETSDDLHIRKIRALGRSLIKQAEYLSRCYNCSINVDNSEYERLPRFGRFHDEIIDNKTGYIRGNLILEIGDYDESIYISKNISKLYDAMPKTLNES